MSQLSILVLFWEHLLCPTKELFPLANFGPVLSSAVTTKANKNLFLPSFVAAWD
jgi:hypothetical protein